MYKKLYKSKMDVKIDGVCAGLANYCNMDPTLMRLIWIIGTVLTQFLGVFAYIVCALVMPRESDYYDHDEFNHKHH